KVNDSNRAFGDGSHILYVNSQIQDDTKLGRLMHDLHCKNADEMYSEVLAARVRQLKETPEGVEYMCKEMDRIYGMGEEQGRAMERKNTEHERKKTERERKKEKLNMKTIHVIEKSIGNNVQKITIKYNYFTQLT
ncbi:MAG: hypothetical protein MR499_12395, partial [Lachnospiraceae bacterium]|nr:hypothetical protein [Lachnospiraceae bacterium]